MDFPKFLRVVVRADTELKEINGTMTVKRDFSTKEVQFVDILSQALKFTYQLTQTQDDDFGRKLPNGSWNGMMGMIERNETDMVANIAALPERLQIADFSYPYHRLRITFATRKPEYHPNPTAFLKPFSDGVWMFIIASLFIMPTVFSMLLTKRRTFSKLVLITMSSLLLQDVDMAPKKVHEYLLLIFWKLAAMSLIYSYTGVLLSFLTFPPLNRISTIPELAAGVAKGECECFGLPGTSISKILSNSTYPEIRIIGENLEQNQNRDLRDVEALLSKRNKSPKLPVFIGGEHVALPLNMKYFISNDEFFPALISVAFQKGFCGRSRMDEAINYVWASGLFQKLASEYLFRETRKAARKGLDDDESNVKPLSMAQFQGAFYVLIFGYILGIVVFTFECLIGKK